MGGVVYSPASGVESSETSSLFRDVLNRWLVVLFGGKSTF